MKFIIDTNNFSEEQGRLIDEHMMSTYRSFVEKAARSRSLSVEELEAHAQGRIWTGRQAVERGLVDGFIAPLAGGFVRLGYHEVVKYIVVHYFYQLPGVFLANPRNWNKIPEQDRNMMISMAKEMEPAFVKHYRQIHDTELKKAMEKGVKIIEFSPENAKYFLDTAYRVGWESLKKRAPENGPKLQKLSQ